MVAIARTVRILAVLSALVAALAALPASAQVVGVVKTVSGEVKIVRDASERTAKVGDDLLLLDQVSTGSDGACGVILGDGTRVSLGPNGLFEIAEYVFEPSTGSFGLVLRALFGRLVYDAGRIGQARPDRVRIETPFLSIGTRGTRFALLLPGATR